MTKCYNPIGRVYQVKFNSDNGNLYWENNVVVPADEDVITALRILEKAYPGFRVRELKEIMEVHHGYMNKQEYKNEDGRGSKTN